MRTVHARVRVGWVGGWGGWMDGGMLMYDVACIYEPTYVRRHVGEVRRYVDTQLLCLEVGKPEAASKKTSKGSPGLCHFGGMAAPRNGSQDGWVSGQGSSRTLAGNESWSRRCLVHACRVTFLSRVRSITNGRQD